MEFRFLVPCFTFDGSDAPCKQPMTKVLTAVHDVMKNPALLPKVASLSVGRPLQSKRLYRHPALSLE